MPTGLYASHDMLTGTTPTTTPNASSNGVSSNGRYKTITKVHGLETAQTTVETDVPLGMIDIPPPRSLRMWWRFGSTLLFSLWMFARLLFWNVYVARYFPGWVERGNMKRWRKYAREFRRFAVKKGGVFIKMGQFISTRVDILPEEIVRELESLQDEVPTIAFSKIEKKIEHELGPINQRYSWFNQEPIAAASLGQVHRARLLNGERVVVKVQRPGIRQVCYTDLSSMRIVFRVASRFGFIKRRVDAVQLGEEFGNVLLEELSYNHETYNAERFAKMFESDMRVYIPAVYREHSTDHILTLEDVTSIKLNDFAAIEAAGISRKEVAERLMETYMEQVFGEFFFHADPHPGNLFIYPLPVDNVQKYLYEGGGRPFYLIYIDFGMTGNLTREIADGMVNTLAAVITRDPEKMVRSFDELGFIMPGSDLKRITEAAKAAFDEVWGLSIEEIQNLDYERAADIASEFGDLLSSMPFYMPQDFIYLGRTMSILSGMCTSLDPNFNPWSEVEPYAQRLAAQGFGMDVDLKNGKIDSSTAFQSLFNGNGGQALVSLGQELMRRTAPINPTIQVLEELRSGEIRMVAELSLQHKAQLKRLEAQGKIQTRAFIFGSVLITSTLLYTNGDTTPALIGYGFCGLSALYGFLKG